MKKLLVLISLVFAAATYGQSTTNNLAVVLSTNQIASLNASWKYDTQLRTNGLAPYTTTLPAQTFSQFASGIASEALSEKAVILEARREAEMLALWRQVSPNIKSQAFKILQSGAPVAPPAPPASPASPAPLKARRN